MTPASACRSSAPGLAAAGIAGNGTPEQVIEWVPQCYGTPDNIQLGAFCVSEPDAGSDVTSLRTRAVYDEANDEWVLNGTKAWITNGGIADVHVVVAAVDPTLKGRGQASFVIPPGTPGLSQGQKYKKHGIRASHTAEVVLDDVRVPGPLPARRQGEARREAGPGPEARRTRARSSRRWRPSRRPARRSARRPSASPGRPTSTRSTTPRSAWRSASRSSEPGASRSCSPTWPPRSTPPACWCGGRRGWPATACRSPPPRARCRSSRPAEVAVWVTERAIQILGGYGYTREYPVERWHRDAKIYDIFEGTRDPAPRDRPGHLRPAHRVVLG